MSKTVTLKTHKPAKKHRRAHATPDELIAAAYKVLKLHHPMTVRQVYYRLVANQTIQNDQKEYKRVGEALVKARRFKQIPWEWIEDRIRKPEGWNGHETMGNFLDTVPAYYRRDVWQDQPTYVELWLEKDALSGVFKPTLWNYRVTLNVGRGYDSWSSVYATAKRYKALPPWKPVTILYFGDFDPSGVHIPVNLGERLGDLGVFPDIKRVGLNPEDIDTFSLPTDPAKASDSRTPAFEEEYGRECVELDALLPEVLQAKAAEALEAEMDMDILRQSLEKERRLKKWLQETVPDLVDDMPEGDELEELDDGEEDDEE